MAFIARGTALLLLMASALAIVAATTMPWSAYYVGHSHWEHVEWIPFSRTVRPVDFILNVLLFVPFGFSAANLGRDASPTRPRAATGTGTPQVGTARRAVRSRTPPAFAKASAWQAARRPYLVVSAACLLSLAVELFQVYCHGRLPTMTDVLANVVGAWLGTTFPSASRRSFARRCIPSSRGSRPH